MYLCAQNHDLKRGGTFETAKAGTFHSVTAGTSIPLFTIKSRIKDVIASIDTDKYTIVCGHMAYDGYTSKPYEECLFSKEPYFKDEHEVRFYFIPNNESMNSIKGENISVLPDIMIDEITLSPYIKEIAAVKIAELLRREYDLNVINLSKIRLK